MTITTQAKFFDPAQDAVIKEFRQELIGFATVEGKATGTQNRPGVEGEYRARMFNPVVTKTQTHLDANHALHTPLSGLLVARKMQEEANTQIHLHQATITEGEHQLFPLLQEKKQFNAEPGKEKLRLWVLIGVIVISIAEGWFANESLRAAGFPTLSACFSALAISAAVGFGTHFLASYIKRSTTATQQVVRYLIVLIPAFAGLFVLGNCRANAYNQAVQLDAQIRSVTTHSEGILSSWGISAISCLLFATALYLSVVVHPSEEERKRDNAYKQICKEIAEIEQQIQSAKQSIATIQSTTAATIAEALARFEFAVAIERRLQTIAEEALEAYKVANLRYRSDNFCPPFFVNPLPLHFRLFFNPVQHKTHEKAPYNHLV